MGLDQAALDAVRQWRYEPATLRGQPVAVAFHLVVRFELQ
jgi:TonB family protein